MNLKYKKTGEVQSSDSTSQNFFKAHENNFPLIKNLSAFKTIMKVTVFVPVMVTIGLLVFLWFYHPMHYLLFLFLFACFVISLGVASLTRHLLLNLAKNFELTQSLLKQSEEHFRLLANAIPELVSVADGEGKALWYNDAWYRYTGSSPKEKSGINWAHVHHPDHLPIVFEKWKMALETSEPFEIQFPLKSKEGKYRRFLYRATPVKDPHDRLLFWFGTSTDIESEMIRLEDQQFLKEANSALNRSLDFQTTLSSSVKLSSPYLTDWGSALFFDNEDPTQIREHVCSGEGDVTALVSLVNWTLLRQQSVEVVDLNSAFAKGIAPTKFSWLVAFSIQSGGALKGAYFFLSKDPNGFDSRKLEVLSEFTKLCTNAFENAKLNENLREAVQSRDEFISVASHELKTPLTSLQLRLQILERQLPEGAVVKTENLQNLFYCLEQIRKLDHLIDQLFDTTAIRNGKVQLKRTTCDLSFQITEVCKRFQSEAGEKGVRLDIVANDSILGNWDPVRLDQIISNLVSNSIKYGNGKPVVISSEKAENTKKAKLIVQDHGVGIPEKNQRNIFDRFTRVPSEKGTPGLGLGLYICHQLVQAHGGTIEVKSKEGQGSTFTVTLPLY